MPVWLSLISAAVLAILGWNLYRRFGTDRIAAFTEKRRATSRFVSRGQLVDGNRRMDVALALTRSTFFYENADMQATLELQWVNEVEYDSQLATGSSVAGGRVLRLRCYSQMFEFIIPTDVVERWHLMLPPRRSIEPGIPIAAALAPTVTA